MEYCGKSLIRSRIGSAVGEAAMVRDFGAKLRITAAALGCASQKDLCAPFREANPGTIFELDRSYKWMQGRALPRSVGLYEDWAALLGTSSSIAYLQSCTVDEFLDLVCDRHKVSRDSLAARAGIMVGTAAHEAPADRSHEAGIGWPRYRHRSAPLSSCTSVPWSSCLQGKIIRGGLVIAATAAGATELQATTIYSGPTSLGRVQLSGPVRVNRAIFIDLIDAGEEFRVSMCLFVPGALANVLAGVASGASWFDADPQPAASRLVLISHTGRNGGGARGVEPVCRRDAAAFGRPRGARHCRRGVSRVGRAAGRIPAGR